MIVCLYFYCKATEQWFVLEVVFGEWAKTVVRNLENIVETFKIESVLFRKMLNKHNAYHPY